MYILVCSLDMNFEIGCKVIKNVLYAQQFLYKMFYRESKFVKKVFYTHNISPSNCIKIHIYQSFSTFQRTLLRGKAAF